MTAPMTVSPRPAAPSRRTLLLAGALGLAGAGLSACGGADDLTFWYWPGALSDAVVDDVVATTGGRFTVRVLDGNVEQELRTAFTAGRGQPDATGIKGEDMPGFLGHADDFLDLDLLGARTLADGFATAKLAAGRAADGRQVGLPIDIGPTATFLRADLWSRAGLPTDPAAAGALVGTWDGWFEAATRLRDALPGTYAIRNSGDVFGVALAQQPATFVDPTGAFAGDGQQVRSAWDLAVRAVTEHVQAGIYDDDSYGAALSAGVLTGHVGPVWNGLDIESAAPGTSGAWRVAACPGGPASIGGSYLALPSTCRDPEASFALIASLLTPQGAARAFADASVFPAVIAAYSLPALTAGQAFYGGQVTTEVFGPAAEALPQVYEDARDDAVARPYYIELANVEGGKDPEQAWADALAAGRDLAEA